MAGKFFESIEEAYSTRDLYEVLGVTKTASESEIKRAYHKLSLKVHPDRVPPDEVEISTTKFQILSKIYLILSDSDKRAIYNETGCIPEDDDIHQERDWAECWKLLFKSVTIEDIQDFEKKYKNSEEEADCLRSAYMDYEGDMDKIMDSVLCAQIEDEPRFRGLIAGWIAEGSVPSYPLFMGETEKKQKRRKRKYDKEAQEAEEMRQEMGLKDDDDDGLKSLIKARQQDRERQLGSFFDDLEQKYAKKPKKSKTTVIGNETSSISNSKKENKKKGKK